MSPAAKANRGPKRGVTATDKLRELKARVAKLEATIIDKDTREYFLQLPRNWLDDVERNVSPGAEVMLPLIEQQLAQVEDAVSKYGPDLRIIG